MLDVGIILIDSRVLSREPGTLVVLIAPPEQCRETGGFNHGCNDETGAPRDYSLSCIFKLQSGCYGNAALQFGIASAAGASCGNRILMN